MIEAIIAVVSTLASIILLWIQRSEKTKSQKARDVVDRNRTRAKRMRVLLEERNLDELERELERQDRESAAVLGVPRKAGSSS